MRRFDDTTSTGLITAASAAAVGAAAYVLPRLTRRPRQKPGPGPGPTSGRPGHLVPRREPTGHSRRPSPSSAAPRRPPPPAPPGRPAPPAPCPPGSAGQPAGQGDVRRPRPGNISGLSPGSPSNTSATAACTRRRSADGTTSRASTHRRPAKHTSPPRRTGIGSPATAPARPTRPGRGSLRPPRASRAAGGGAGLAGLAGQTGGGETTLGPPQPRHRSPHRPPALRSAPPRRLSAQPGAAP